MATGREIISFQFGHYSNFIGAHWWNIQEAGFLYNSDKPSDINHDVLFREGETIRREVTFTPRLLLVDLQGSLKHLSTVGELYDIPTDPCKSNVEWPENSVEIVETSRASKNQFLEDLDKETTDLSGNGDANTSPIDYNLDEAVTVWSDYLRTRYHPRTVNITNDFQHKSETKSFDVFSYGHNLWKTDPFQVDFADLIRNYAEECDNMQGFHVLLDGTDGFAGLGTSAIEYLRDDYPSKSVLAFPTISSAFPDSTALQDSVRSMNLLLGLQSLAEHSSLFVPLCTGSDGWKKPGAPRTFEQFTYNDQLAYHSSAILASALDTLSLRYRMRNPEQVSSLSDLTNSLSYLGRRAAAASLSMPFAWRSDSYLMDCFEDMAGIGWNSLTPSCPLELDHTWIQSVALRGVPLDRLRNPKSAQGWGPQQANNPAYSCSTREEMLQLFLSFNCYSTASHVTVADSPLSIALPFPRIFTKDEFQGKKAIPAIAGLHSCKGVGTMLESLHTDVSKVAFHKRRMFQEAGLEKDEYKESLNNILQLRESYLEDFE